MEKFEDRNRVISDDEPMFKMQDILWYKRIKNTKYSLQLKSRYNVRPIEKYSPYIFGSYFS